MDNTERTYLALAGVRQLNHKNRELMVVPTETGVYYMVEITKREEEQLRHILKTTIMEYPDGIIRMCSVHRLLTLNIDDDYVKQLANGLEWILTSR